MKRFILLALLVWLTPAQSENLIMVRSQHSFPETMLQLQKQIEQHGYVLSRVQRVDIGLTEMGYQTDKYRVVFLGKPEEIRALSARYPDLIPYMPLKISVFAENDQTLLSTMNPVMLSDLFADPELKQQFKNWERDIRSMLEKVRLAE